MGGVAALVAIVSVTDTVGEGACASGVGIGGGGHCGGGGGGGCRGGGSEAAWECGSW